MTWSNVLEDSRLVELVANLADNEHLSVSQLALELLISLSILRYSCTADYVTGVHRFGPKIGLVQRCAIARFLGVYVDACLDILRKFNLVQEKKP